MKPRYLVCCLFALGLSGCGQHFVKPTDAASLEQRSVTAVHSLYHTSGFDYHGQMVFAIPPSEKAKKSGKTVSDVELNQHLKNYMVQQGITLNRSESVTWEKALQQAQTTEGYANWRQRGSEIATNFLQDLTVSYDGGMDFRQKIVALNLTARYDTNGLLVQAKYPMIVDFKETKLYSDYFSLLPFLVSPEYRGQLSYIDFSQYRAQIEKVDLAALVNYLKETSSLPYLLASSGQLQRIALSNAETKAGAVEKIRLNSSVEEMTAQMLAYTRVNQDYLSQKVFQLTDKAPVADKTETQDFKQMTPEQQATWATDRLKEMTATEAELSEAAQAGEAAAQAAEKSAQTEDQAEAVHDEGLTKQQCQAYSAKSNIPLGIYVYCADEYQINLFTPSSASSADFESSVTQFVQLSTLFTPDNAQHLITVEQFKSLWQQKHEEIEKILPAQVQRRPLVIDLTLDKQGRLMETHYDLALLKKNADQQPIHILAKTQYKNYGHPQAIHRAAMRQAKPLGDVRQDSIFKGLMDKIEQKTNKQDFNTQVQQFAEQRYVRTQSYVKTYQLVYGLLFARDYPQAVKKYTAQDIQNLATLMAYRSLADEDSTTNLTRQEQRQLQQLEQQYQVGRSQLLQRETREIVLKAQSNGQQQRQWQQIQQHYPSSAQRFSKWYEAQYLFENTGEKPNQHLKRIAERLGQFYEASRLQTMSPILFAGLTDEDYEYLDYTLFKSVYMKVLETSK